jgi:hypothetical protein
MHYVVKNRIPNILPCNVQDLYNEALFYGIDLPANDCWGTILSYTLKNINTYNIRDQLKSFVDQYRIFGWAEWRRSLSLDIEFHCHRTIDLNLVKQYMFDQTAKQFFMIQSSNQKDNRFPSAALFQCPKTREHHKEINTFKEKLDLQAMTKRNV